MFKYFTLLFIGIAAVLAFLYFRVGVPDIYANQNSIKVSAHIYDKPDLSIKKINLIAVYFVPKDRQELQITDWQERLDNSLSRLTAFHRLETSGNSVINYVIYPQPMIGLELGQNYDTENTNYGNPHALIAVGRELEARLLSPDGDLWSPEIAAPVYKNSYRSVIVLYEGTGASGAVGEPMALLSRLYLTRPEYQTYGTTLLAHEFYHTLGLPEGYEVPSEDPITSDIMGAGRLKSIERTYINADALDRLGL